MAKHPHKPFPPVASQAPHATSFLQDSNAKASIPFQVPSPLADVPKTWPSTSSRGRCRGCSEGDRRPWWAPPRRQHVRRSTPQGSEKVRATTRRRRVAWQWAVPNAVPIASDRRAAKKEARGRPGGSSRVLAAGVGERHRECARGGRYSTQTLSQGAHCTPLTHSQLAEPVSGPLGGV